MKHACFPSSVVDRIVPVVGEKDVQRVRTGVRSSEGVTSSEDTVDSSDLINPTLVTTEPFAQWIIEDDFVQGTRPNFEKMDFDSKSAIGAKSLKLISPTISTIPFETVKLGYLNGAHSTLAYVGLALGLEIEGAEGKPQKTQLSTVSQAITDPDLQKLVGFLWREVRRAMMAGLEIGNGGVGDNPKLLNGDSEHQNKSTEEVRQTNLSASTTTPLTTTKKSITSTPTDDDTDFVNEWIAQRNEYEFVGRTIKGAWSVEKSRAKGCLQRGLNGRGFDMEKFKERRRGWDGISIHGMSDS